MKRNVRLISARDWLRAVGNVRAGDYARRYNVDKYTAYAEMASLGATINDHDRKYAVRPAPIPRRRRPGRDPDPPPALPGLTEWGGDLILAVDFTAGGAPIGLQGEDVYELLRDLEPPGHRLKD